jgi:ferredoxin-type protein NapH
VSAKRRNPGAEAVTVKGWWPAYRWLLLRRAAQFGILVLFLLGPLAGIWIVKGNINASMVLDFVPLNDPFVLLQSLAAGHAPELTAITGALIIVALYLLVGGRAYCAWVCPVNIVTDTAQWLRRRLRLKGAAKLSAATRYWILATSLVVSLITGVIAWELVNPVSMTYRGLVFGMGAAWLVVLAIFLFDLLVSERGWCGALCPVGAFYSILGRFSIARVSAVNREQCNDCTDCLKVCPEPHVLKLPVYGADKGASPIVLSPNCTNCGRCIDVCTEDVFCFTTRFEKTHNPISTLAEETPS